MRSSLRKLFLIAIQTDTTATFDEGEWRTKCLHCRSRLILAQDGEPLNGATLEHVVPQSWFDKRAAADLIADMTGPNDARNLSLACPRCNQGKGARHDAKGPNHARAREVVTQLKHRRMERWKPLPDAVSSDEGASDAMASDERGSQTNK